MNYPNTKKRSKKSGLYVILLTIGALSCSCTSEISDSVTQEPDIPVKDVLSDDIKVVPGRLRVKFNKGTEPDLKLLSSIGAGKMERVFPYAGKFEERTRKEGLDRWYNVWYDNDIAGTKAVSSLSGIDGIEVVENVISIRRVDFGNPVPVSLPIALPYGIGTSSAYPVDDPGLSKQWHYHNDGSLPNSAAGADINLFRAWEVTSGSNEVVVAIVDGGIDYNHEDLAGNVGNWAELYGKEGVDDDGNGYVDDIYGWNFIYTRDNPNGTNKITAVAHGTHVAGTVGAENNNGVGVCGVAGGKGGHSGVRLLSCQMFTNNKSDDGDADAAIKYGADAGAVISQNSWGYDGAYYMPLSTKEAIDYFIKYAGIDENGNQTGPMKGGIVIFASGNDDRDYLSYPSCYEKVLAVSAMAPDFRKAYYSNYATWVDVTAPGGTYRYQGDYSDECPVYSTLPGNQYGYMQGTSMACPHVSGIAALAVAKHGGPGFTPDKLWAYLTKGVHNIDDYNPDYKGRLGSGYIDAYLAVSSDEGYAPDAVSDLEHSDTAGEVELTWTVPADKDDEKAESFILMWRVGTLDNPDPDNLPEGSKSVVVYSEDRKAGDKMSYMLEGMNEQTRYTVAIIAVDPWGNRSQVTSISFGTPANEPPVLSTGAVMPVQVKYHENTRVVFDINDPDSKEFTYEMRDPSTAVSASIEGNKLYLDIFNYKKRAGVYSLHLTVSDSFGASDAADLSFELLPDLAPVVVDNFPPVYLGSLKEMYDFLPSAVFDDEIISTVSYALSYDRKFLFLQELADKRYRIMPLVYGRSVVHVTATDEGGNSTETSFAVLCRDDSREVDLYPNPVRDFLNIRMGRNVSGKMDVSVIDASGRTVLSWTGNISPTEPVSVDMSSLGGGGYTVKMAYPGGTIVRPVVKL